MRSMRERTFSRRRMRALFLCALMLCALVLRAETGQAATKPITLNKTVYVMKKGKSYKLTKKINNSKYKKNKILWTSSKKTVATVDSNGLVKAKAKGTTTITAKISGTSYKATCKIRVGYPVTSVKLNTNQISFDGENGGESTYQILTSLKPANATVKTVSYVSSNKNVATVDSKGVITAGMPGKAIITVKANDGSGKSAKISITVVNGNKIVQRMFELMDGYSEFIKKNAALCKKNGNNPILTYEEAQDNAQAGKTIYLNCTSPIRWALTEMGYLFPDKTFYGYGKEGFKIEKNSQKEIDAVADTILSGYGVGYTVQQAANLGLIQYGDILSITNTSWTLNHTCAYAGTDENGHAMVYEAGGDPEKIGYAIAGCGPIDYYNRYKDKYIKAIIRFRGDIEDPSPEIVDPEGEY